jgi:16S rRNA (uracil1498-N3)-methyltransferase
MSRFYVSAALTEGQELELPEDAFRHWVQVLRARVGDSARLFDGSGYEFEASLLAIGKRSAQVRVGTRIAVDRESPLRLSLAQAVSKGDRMDYTLQKAVELGISEIQPLLSERTVVKLDAERWEKKLEHWRGVIVSACEQSGRTRLPALHPVLRLDSWLAQPPAHELRLTLAPTAQSALRDLPKAASACLLVGPEGGLSDAEITLAQRSGWTAVKLGPRVLRTETAGVAAMSAMQALWGDLG